MYYEIDSIGKKIRPLPGYFEGFKADLEKVEESLLSETQADYMAIDPSRIIHLTEEEHLAYVSGQEKNQESVKAALQYLNETDYKIIKEMETGEKCPEDILIKRTECRIIINDLQGA